jgi:hypothetical protein
MSTLPQSVNASIRAAGTVHAGFRAQNARERGFETVLNRVAIRLALPSAERSAIISDY